MALIIGTRPYGTCDVIPELCYVTTFFLHVNFVPLIPTGSHVVLGKSGSSYATIPIPLSAKSIFLAWGRTLTFILAVLVTIVGFAVVADGPLLEKAVLAAVALVLWGLYLVLMILPRRRLPSFARARQLGQIVGLNETGWAAMYVLYGRDPITGEPLTGDLGVLTPGPTALQQ